MDAKPTSQSRESAQTQSFSEPLPEEFFQKWDDFCNRLDKLCMHMGIIEVDSKKRKLSSVTSNQAA